MRIPSHLETRQQRDVGPPPSATPVSAQLRQISLSGYRCGSGPHDAQRFTRAGAGALRHPPSEGEPAAPEIGAARCGSWLRQLASARADWSGPAFWQKPRRSRSVGCTAFAVAQVCEAAAPAWLPAVQFRSSSDGHSAASAWPLSLPSKSTLKVCRTRANKSRSEVGCCFASSIGRPWAHSVAVTVPSSSAARVRAPASGCSGLR